MILNALFIWVVSNFSFALRNFDMFSIIWMLVALAVMVGLFVFLIFKSHKVVNLLKLDKNFDDERIDFGNFNPSSIVKIALIIIGGFLIIENIPAFLSHTLFAFKVDVIGMNYKSMHKFNWAVSGIKLVLGFLIVTNYSGIASLLKLNEKAK
jgi:hypothetical protein